jgi:hypothetical protein
VLFKENAKWLGSDRQAGGFPMPKQQRVEDTAKKIAPEVVDDKESCGEPCCRTRARSSRHRPCWPAPTLENMPAFENRHRYRANRAFGRPQGHEEWGSSSAAVGWTEAPSSRFCVAWFRTLPAWRPITSAGRTMHGFGGRYLSKIIVRHR